MQVAGGPWARDAMIRAGDAVKLRLTTAADSLTSRTATLYAEGVAAPWVVTTSEITDVVASGGTVSYVQIGAKYYAVHTFLASGDFVVTAPGHGQAEVLLVGGGGGASTAGGGGGGVLIETVSLAAQTYPVVVGAGGVGVRGDATPRPVPGNNGEDSTAFGLTALGGGGGAGTDHGGVDGGSGGGAGASSKPSNPSTGGAGLQPGSASGGFGNKGGDVLQFSSPYPAAGGGGGGAAGGDADGGVGGAGGDGYATDFRGATEHFGGGGGGGFWTGGSGGAGGLGGGGSGVSTTDGAANTGGGGGGGRQNAKGGDGGSGIVAIRYEISESKYNANV